MERKPSGGDETGTVVELANTSFLIPLHVKRELRILAARNERTLSAEIRAALAAHVERGAA